MAIYESGEDYLETILVLHKRNDIVRSIDVASELGFSKPSVSRAMSILKKDGYIYMDEKGHITLSEKGQHAAESIYDRHNNISKFLMEILGVSEENALKDACRIEHDLSNETYGKICEALVNK
ncbi:metal-dependent transcriptional regulator [Aminipila terrae]|uniref:Metal-dependent transcriptional regulator n=1 Tax=Aminipila terrae TaxID=2697030 RepID=A0A6P1MBS5_9FIRM|nr:metal-dependent transcriptional regulator [Aminipila terrae]QHI72159.1 metal-dependent transcriptional regulator [Aminipila terrae]